MIRAVPSCSARWQAASLPSDSLRGSRWLERPDVRARSLTLDQRNNLEGVFLGPHQHSGTLTLRVEASNIAANALNPWRAGRPAQDFALACYNCRTIDLFADGFE